MRVRTSLSVVAVLTLCGSAACGEDTPTRPFHDPDLERARQATTRYAELDAALDDGYVDIDVVMSNMGHHYLKPALLDGRFEVERPEILVYASEGGRMRLVAVEYAVPLDRSESAPAGFTGDLDRWARDTGFQLWLLHAWVHRENPSGVFNPTNPRVP